MIKTHHYFFMDNTLKLSYSDKKFSLQHMFTINLILHLLGFNKYNPYFKKYLKQSIVILFIYQNEK